MERYRPVPRPNRLASAPSAAALEYREHVAPLAHDDFSTIPTHLSLPDENGSVLTAEKVPAAALPVQVFPPPEPSYCDEQTPAVTTETILAKIRAPYDRHLRGLARTRKRLRVSTAVEADAADEPPICAEPAPEPTYPTPFGALSFPALYDRTRKYAAYVLHYTYQVNAADLDDGLQAGYGQLWQRLQSQPDLLQDKSLAWIGKGIVYRALHATRGDWQFRRRTVPDQQGTLDSGPRPAKVEWKAHSRETRQADVRTDVHRAIQTVAEHILSGKGGKRGDHDLWALYGLTMLQASASEVSRLFGVREQSMQKAYQRVRGWLQEALPNYAPPGATRPARQHGRAALPRQDMVAIQKGNGDVPVAVYEAVGSLIQKTKADTWAQDLLALEGIRRAVPVQTQARAHGLSTSRMQRAYARVHLMIGAQRDPSVRVRRPERRVKPVFTLTAETAAAVERLAQELLKQPKSYEKLVALHAHIGNLAISTTAKHFNIPTSTLRYYAQQIGVQLETPMKPAREE
jgi:hypothetical protein